MRDKESARETPRYGWEAGKEKFAPPTPTLARAGLEFMLLQKKQTLRAAGHLSDASLER